MLGAATTAVVLAVAEAAGRAGLVDPAVLPLTSTALARAAGLAGDPDFMDSAAVTVAMWGGGRLIAIGLAVPMGIALGSLVRLETALRPIVEFLRPLPSVALIPLALLVLGDQGRMTVSLTAYACGWPILIHTVSEHLVRRVARLLRQERKRRGTATIPGR
jgi:NitT/TauT family transport system permease protein